jgi:hypothetical protein
MLHQHKGHAGIRVSGHPGEKRLKRRQPSGGRTDSNDWKILHPSRKSDGFVLGNLSFLFFICHRVIPSNASLSYPHYCERKSQNYGQICPYFYEQIKRYNRKAAIRNPFIADSAPSEWREMFDS